MKSLKPFSKKSGAATGMPSLWEGFSGAPETLFQRGLQWPSQGLNTPWPAAFLKNPPVDISEDDREITVKAEVPGLSEKDLSLNYSEGTLYLKGMKKEEKEEKGKNTWHRESWQGAFTRAIPLGDRVDWKKVEAKYKGGVLTVTIPKVAGKENRVKIDIQ